MCVSSFLFFPLQYTLYRLQNGYLEDYLESKGLAENTQALIYFAVSKKGETPIDGITDLSPGGLTVTTGKWAEVVAERIQACGMKCGVVDTPTYRKAMFEKLMWICAFMLVGTVNGGITVGEVVESKTGEVCMLQNRSRNDRSARHRK